MVCLEFGDVIKNGFDCLKMSETNFISMSDGNVGKYDGKISKI